MENLEKLNLTELKADELQQTSGGGWIADAVEWLICSCGTSSPSGQDSIHGGGGNGGRWY